MIDLTQECVEHSIIELFFGVLEGTVMKEKVSVGLTLPIDYFHPIVCV